jgi:hypothetical protein
MNKNLLVAGGLIGLITCFVSFGLIFVVDTMHPFLEYNFDKTYFDNSTPEATAVSIARLNFGMFYDEMTVTDVYLADKGKYWKVSLDDEEGPYQVTIDAKTLMSKVNNNRWRSQDELKARYIAEIQARKSHPIGKPSKITMEGKEIWKVPVYYYHESDPIITEYVYVDLKNGRSKNELYHHAFCNYTGEKPVWLSLKRVDDIIDKIEKADGYDYSDSKPFKDALRNLYPE